MTQNRQQTEGDSDGGAALPPLPEPPLEGDGGGGKFKPDGAEQQVRLAIQWVDIGLI